MHYACSLLVAKAETVLRYGSAKFFGCRWTLVLVKRSYGHDHEIVTKSVMSRTIQAYPLYQKKTAWRTE